MDVTSPTIKTRSSVRVQKRMLEDEQNDDLYNANVGADARRSKKQKTAKGFGNGKLESLGLVQPRANMPVGLDACHLLGRSSDGKYVLTDGRVFHMINAEDIHRHVSAAKLHWFEHAITEYQKGLANPSADTLVKPEKALSKFVTATWVLPMACYGCAKPLYHDPLPKASLMPHATIKLPEPHVLVAGEIATKPGNMQHVGRVAGDSDVTLSEGEVDTAATAAEVNKLKKQLDRARGRACWAELKAKQSAQRHTEESAELQKELEGSRSNVLMMQNINLRKHSQVTKLEKKLKEKEKTLAEQEEKLRYVETHDSVNTISGLLDVLERKDTKIEELEAELHALKRAHQRR